MTTQWVGEDEAGEPLAARPARQAVNGYEAISVALRGSVGWFEDELAAHQPPVPAAQQFAEGVSAIALMAAMAGKGQLPPGDLDAMLRGDGNATLMLRGKPAERQPGRHQRQGVFSRLRQWRKP